jgi:hypothetical protein
MITADHAQFRPIQLAKEVNLPCRPTTHAISLRHSFRFANSGDCNGCQETAGRSHVSSGGLQSSSSSTCSPSSAARPFLAFGYARIVAPRRAGKDSDADPTDEEGSDSDAGLLGTHAQNPARDGVRRRTHSPGHQDQNQHSARDRWAGRIAPPPGSELRNDQHGTAFEARFNPC